MKIFQVFLMALVMIFFTNSSFARTQINEYWTGEVDDSNQNCNILTTYNSGQSMLIIADNDGVHILIQDPAFNNISNGNYRIRFYFDNMPDLNGTAHLEGNVIVLPGLSTNAVRSLMLANYVAISSGTYSTTYALNGSGYAIRAMIRCAANHGYMN